MDFKLLNRTQTAHQLKSQRNTNRGEVRIQQGLKLVEQADAEEFAQPGRLRKAAQLLLEAIDLTQADIRPHMGLAYIFGVLGQPETGLEFIAAAREIEPGNPMVEILGQQLAGFSDEQPATAMGSVVSDEVDFDDLYEQTESELKSALMQATQLKLPEPNPHVDTLSNLKSTMQNLYSKFETVQKKIELLDQEFDTSHLLQLSRSLMVMFQRYKQVYRHSKEMHELEECITKTRDNSKTFRKNIQASQRWQQALELRLEQILDNCDEIADALDRLEEANISLNDLLPQYQFLIQEVTDLQDIIDDLPRTAG